MKKILSKDSITRCYKEQPLLFYVIVAIVLSTVVKLSLIETGFLSFPDEFRFMAAGKVIEHVSNGEFSEACYDIFSTKSKPGDVILSTIPHLVQQFTGYLSNVYCYESSNSYPLFIFNFIVYCCLLIVHYKFSKLVLKDVFLSLLSVLVFGTLTNTYLYIRHVLAYDTSLLIFYYFIYKTVLYIQSENLSFVKSVLIGIGSFFAYLVYPGFFPLFFLIVFLLFFYNLTTKNFIKRFLHSCYYGLGSVYLLGVFEAMARYGKVSYIDDALHASSIVNQGSAEESYSFIFKYFWDVEGISGVILLAGIFVFIGVVIYKLQKGLYKENQLIVLLGVSIVGMYLIYTSIGYFFGAFIIMGRSLHEYLPFFCIFFVFTINDLLGSISIRKDVLLFGVAVLFFVNFCTKFFTFYSISYPRDVYWKLSKTNDLNDVHSVCEYDFGWSVTPGEVEYRFYAANHKKVYENSKNYILTNGCYYYPVSDMRYYHPFVPPANYALVDTKTHYLNFKAYQYEGHNIPERANIDQIHFQLKLYEKQQ